MVKPLNRRKHKKLTVSDWIILIFLGLVAGLMLYPIVNVLAISLSSYNASIREPWMLFPKDIDLSGYAYVLRDRAFWRSYLNSIIITGATTIIGLLSTAMMAWSLARKELRGKPFFMGIVIFTMVFSAGMIPGYLNMKELGLLDTLWSVILPGCFSAYNCIVMINFFRQIPYDLVESATIDGASEPYIFTRIILPLSKPVLASIALFLAVGAWNSYFSAQLYLRDRELWPMALTLKELLTAATAAMLDAGSDPSALGGAVQPKLVQYASIIISTVPVMCIYPFLQKYFAKGVMLGSVKG